MNHRRQYIGILLGPVLFLLMVLVGAPDGLSQSAWLTGGVGAWMATWWMTEAVPIPITSLMPLVLFPVLGIATMRDAAGPYSNPLIYLFLGGFILALGMEKCSLHKRIALNVLKRVGTKPASIIAGFMLSCALLSMWVTNTATTMMMLPIALSVIGLAKEQLEGAHLEAFSPALLLSIAYACTIGGLGTLIGTVPNALVAGFMQENYGVELGFGAWMAMGVPIVCVGLPVTYFILTRWVFKLGKQRIPGMHELVESGLKGLGKPNRDEKAVGVIFGLVVVLWITRPLYESIIPGLTDTSIALLGAMLLFLVPSSAYVKNESSWESRFLMDWKTAKTIPWGILVLFGGGLSLAAAIDSTGLAVWMGEIISAINVWPIILITMVVVLLVVFLTELTSNTATTAAFLPVVASLALGIGQNPLLLTIPVTFAASAAFMLPVATPPNAIVYGSDLVSIPQMAKAGIWLNMAFTLILTIMCYFLVQWVFNVEIGVLPIWAQ